MKLLITALGLLKCFLCFYKASAKDKIQKEERKGWGMERVKKKQSQECKGKEKERKKGEREKNNFPLS